MRIARRQSVERGRKVAAHHAGPVVSIPRLPYLAVTGERLRERNLRNLLDFIAEAEAAALVDQAALKTMFAATLGRLVDSDGVMLTGFDSDLQRTVTTASDPRVVERRAQEPECGPRAWLTIPPSRHSRPRTARAVRFSEVLAPSRLPPPADIRYSFGRSAWNTSSTCGPGWANTTVDVGCWRERRDFDEQEREVLARASALPHDLAAARDQPDAEHHAARRLWPDGARGRRPGPYRARPAPTRNRPRARDRPQYGPQAHRARIPQAGRIVAPAGHRPSPPARRHRLPGRHRDHRELLARFDASAPLAPYNLTGRETEVLILAAAATTTSRSPRDSTYAPKR